MEFSAKDFNTVNVIHNQVIIANRLQIRKFCWSYFHLRSHCRVEIALPIIPIDSISAGLVSIIMIETIQVCVMTAGVPPSSFKGYCTVMGDHVIISIFGRKRSSTVIGKRITSSFWVKKDERISYIL